LLIYYQSPLRLNPSTLSIGLVDTIFNAVILSGLKGCPETLFYPRPILDM